MYNIVLVCTGRFRHTAYSIVYFKIIAFLDVKKKSWLENKSFGSEAAHFLINEQQKSSDDQQQAINSQVTSDVLEGSFIQYPVRKLCGFNVVA